MASAFFFNLIMSSSSLFPLGYTMLNFFQYFVHSKFFLSQGKGTFSAETFIPSLFK